MGVTGASYSITPFYDFGHFTPQTDGSWIWVIQLTEGGSKRAVQLTVDPTGTSFTLNGAAIASPPAQLNTVGSSLVSLLTQITTLLGLAAVQTAIKNAPVL
jgi:hypothetical protein